ncbi:MAG: hypothetical protein LC751_03715, partial [Actinobacteria bacterium]|nr:hypothetical protein [Actinomycetota bacterium]
SITLCSKRLLLAFAANPLLVAFAAEDSRACSCARSDTLTEKLWESDTVSSGKVSAASSSPEGQRADYVGTRYDLV